MITSPDVPSAKASAPITAISIPYNPLPGGLIILGESAYTNADYVPNHEHTSDHPEWVIAHWHEKGVSRFDRCIARAVANCDDPTPERLADAWRDVGIANFIGPSTPRGGKRPSKAQWQASRKAFRPWINKWRPARLLVLGVGPKTGNSTYDWLPDDPELPEPKTARYTPVAYRLDDGAFTICHGIPHPRLCSWRTVRTGLDELRRWHVAEGKLVKRKA